MVSIWYNGRGAIRNGQMGREGPLVCTVGQPSLDMVCTSQKAWVSLGPSRSKGQDGMRLAEDFGGDLSVNGREDREKEKVGTHQSGTLV